MYMTKTILITYAVKEEFVPLTRDDCHVVHLCTGVGKTKSAALLTKYICQNKPDLVLNIGTAGTFKHRIGDIFVVNRFVDRDYEQTKLPGIEYEIDGMSLLEGKEALKDWVSRYEKQGICSTGDTFVTRAEAFSGDVIDMEAYAQAYVCKEFEVPFLSVKYITDIVGQNSVEQWESKLAEASKALTSWVNQILPI